MRYKIVMTLIYLMGPCVLLYWMTPRIHDIGISVRAFALACSPIVLPLIILGIYDVWEKK